MKDPNVFSPASEVDSAAIINLVAVYRDFPVLKFVGVRVFGQAEEEELILFEPPMEYLERIGQKVLRQCLRVREGRRTGSKSWQDHFRKVICEEAFPNKVLSNPKCPSTCTESVALFSISTLTIGIQPVRKKILCKFSRSLTKL